MNVFTLTYPISDPFKKIREIHPQHPKIEARQHDEAQRSTYLYNMDVTKSNDYQEASAMKSGLLSASEVDLLKRFISTQNPDVTAQLCTDLIDAIASISSGNVDAGFEIIEEWLETAEICLDPAVMARLKEAQEDFAEGRSTRWEPPVR